MCQGPFQSEGPKRFTIHERKAAHRVRARLLELLMVHVETLSFAKAVCGTCLVLSQYAG